MWLLIIEIGMFLGLPYSQEVYNFPSKESCYEAKAEFIKDYRLDTKYTIICVPSTNSREENK